ncbi:mucin-5AC-like [Daphnia pulex]|uniref:mucin-5AC-like n=1 Tax=Daphnia pulex TaxID=6669 RepID=UPI001EDCD03F|nr:mucin-5AC-like [Daphnia pulex]
MRLLLVMLLVSGLLIGESQAQRPIGLFFNALYINFRNWIGLGGGQSVSTSTSSQPTVTVTATVTTTVIDSPPSVPDDYVEFAPPNSIVPEVMITEAASTESGMSTTAMEEASTEGASTDSPLIIQENLLVESSTPAENNQVELEIVTEGPELDPSDASVIEAMAQILLEIPTTTPDSPTTQSVESETEAIVVKDVPPVAPAVVVATTTTTTTSFPRDSTTFATLAPKRTIHFNRPSWTPTFLKLANRGSTSRYFFPASFRRPKDSGFLEKETISLSPSKPLSVENSVPPRIPYVVKRQIEIESSMTVLNQQQSSVLIARAATAD